MDIFVFFILLASSFAAAATGMLFPTGDWYKTLNKPSWVPPNWVFPIVWTSIYVLIAFAGSRVAGLTGSGYAMAFWGLQITLNTLWTPVFFGLRRLRGALPIMGALWLAVLGCLITHIQLDLLAGLAFVPYLIWLTIAAALNYSVATLNPDQQPLEIHKL
jgi:tryptophan-rich sensory protein